MISLKLSSPPPPPPPLLSVSTSMSIRQVHYLVVISMAIGTQHNHKRHCQVVITARAWRQLQCLQVIWVGESSRELNCKIMHVWLSLHVFSVIIIAEHVITVSSF
jgi:hypothetical protein